VFYVEDNFLPPELIEVFDKYCAVNGTELLSDDHWSDDVTKGVTCYSQDASKTDNALIKDNLYSRLPNARNMTVQIQKYPTDAVLAEHRDSAMSACTIFLNKEWKEEWGGHFMWMDEEDNEYKVTPKYNRAVYSLNSNNKENQLGPRHWVSKVYGPETRSIIQVFTFGEGDPRIGYHLNYLNKKG